MSDLIKRLRLWPLRRGYSEVSIRRTMRDAADEIERLRAALRAIAEDCEADYPPSHGAIKYAARAALGEKE